MLMILLALLAGSGNPSHAQLISTNGYEVGIAPDLWYNSVDGVLVGARFRGQDPRTFLDGPHRIHAGIWLGTRLPDYPVSYFFSWAHPIVALTDVNSEGGMRLNSSMRTGLHLHEAGLQKRWQPGFDEFVSTELEVFLGLYKRFDTGYLLYDMLWQEEPVSFVRTGFRKRARNRLGRWTLALNAITGMPLSTDEPFVNFQGREETWPGEWGYEGLFGQMQLQFMQRIDLPSGFYLRSRLFGGATSAATPPEHRYTASDADAFSWHGSAFTRARGTIPVNWMRSGWVHIPSGPGLRGYTFRTTDLLESGIPAWSQHAVSVNAEFYVPNPLNNYFARIPYAGDFLKLESYLFADGGYLNNGTEWQDPIFNAGAGFMLSLNIPDYMGQNRGFFLRYELPVWLSDPDENEDSFRLRHLLGVGILFRM
ncbi:MAG: hypothetical protein R6U28_00325 [Cyclonatronaceae bacterium]